MNNIANDENWKKSWDEAISLNGKCKASEYLRYRGFKLVSYPASLRFHPALYHSDTQSKHPALIGLIKKDGAGIGIQRLYLDDTEGKLCAKILGAVQGGYIEFGEKPTDKLHLAEGIETALAIHEILHEPTWAVVTATNLSRVAPPKTVKIIHIWADKDRSNTGEREAIKAAQFFISKGDI